MPQRKKLRYYNKHLYGGTDDLCPICLEELNEDDDTLECDNAGCRFRCHSHCLEELCRAREPYRRVCPYCKNPNICDQLDNTSIINIVENLYNENLRRFRNEINVLLRHDVVRVELRYRSPGVIYSILSPNNVATGIEERVFHNTVDDTPEELLLEWLNTHFDKYKTTAFSIDGRDTERLSLEIRERYENLEQIKQETIDLKILWFFVDISTKKYISHLQNLYDHLFTVFREYKPIVERNLSYRLPPTNTIMEQYNTLKKVAKDIYYFRTILIKRENYVNLTNASNIRTHYRDGDISAAMGLARGAIQSYNNRDRALENALQNIQLNAEELEIEPEPEPEPDPQEIIGGSDMQNGGAGYGFTGKLHKLLTNQEYSNIISWTNDNDGNVLILLKDKLLVANEVCPRSANIDFHSCARQFCNYGFKTKSRKKIQRIGENELVFSNPKVKSIDDILTLERKLPQSCRSRVNSPTIDDRNRDIANVLMQLSYRSTDMDNNEAANVLASIANISDENTEERVSYLQNLELNSRNSLNIALLIEALLKNDVVDENEKNQIKQKQKELWQYLKEIPLEDNRRRDILFKYMFEYLTRTIPLAKLHKAGQIAKGINDSIKRAQIHNRPTEPLTESEQKQADEEMNASISRGQMLAQDEDTNMEDVQSRITPIVEEPWWKKGGITDNALVRLHSEPVDGHMIEVWALDHWKLGRAVRKKGRSQVVLKAPLNSPSSRVAETVRQIVTQVDYIDGTSVDELLHRGDWKQRQNPWMKDSEDYFLNLGSDNPKYWRYAKSNSRS
uniref:RING-type domain-containing protein n=1 Tax=viral metagenome TaxID=1070528 RepID=A0A6C0KYQ7_9ZZZZ